MTRYFVHKFLPRNLSSLEEIQSLRYTRPTVRPDLRLQRLNLARIDDLLSNLVPFLCKLSILRACISLERPLPRNWLIVHGQTQHPIWFDASSCVASDGERVQTEIVTARWSDGFVANGHGASIGDAVECVVDRSRRQIPKLAPACGRVVIERCDRAKRLDEVEIVW